MISIFIAFINDRVKIIRKNGQKYDEIKPFKDFTGDFTTVKKNSIKLEFLPNERPYTKGNIPFTSLTIYKGELGSYLEEALEYFSKVTLEKEKFNEIYILTDNQPYIIKEFLDETNILMKELYGAKYKGCYYIPFVIKGILNQLAKLKMKDYMFISDTMIVSSSFTKKCDYFMSLYIEPSIQKNKGIIEEIYHKTELNLIYDTIPYELIADMILGGIKKFLDGYDANVEYRAQDRIIKIPESDIIQAYNEIIVSGVKNIIKDTYTSGSIVSYYTESEVFLNDLENILERNCRMMFPPIVFFNYIEFLGLINNDIYIKTIKIAHGHKDILYSKINNMGRNTKKYEKIYMDIFKDYKNFF